MSKRKLIYIEWSNWKGHPSYHVTVNGKYPDRWFRCYTAGLEPPRYPAPAIPLRVSLGEDYPKIVYIDDMRYPDDPQMVRYWDFFGPMETWSA